MATISVSDASGLTAAMAQVKAGDTILLASGDYGAFSTGNDYASAVTIKSANAGAPATFSSISLNGATGITFDSITFDYKYKVDASLQTSPFTVSGSSNIAFKNSIFDGDVASGRNSIDDGYAVGRGLAINSSDGVTVENSVFQTWMRGLVVSESSNVKILNNEVTGIRSDGMNFIEVKNVLIEGNNIHDFRAAPNSGDHGDMIQFWTTGTTSPSTDITIRNNILNIGQGSWAQSLFMRNEVVDKGLAGDAMYYQNVLIENNTISNAHIHGITVGETDGLIVRNNVLIAATMNLNNAYNAAYAAKYGSSAGVMVPHIGVSDASDNVTVTGNSYSGAPWSDGVRLNGYTNQPDWNVSNNTYFADKASIPAGSGASNSGDGTTPTPTPVPDPIPDPVPNPVPAPTPTTPAGTLPVLDDYVLDFANLAKTAFRDNAQIVTVGGEKMIRLDGIKDYVNLGRLTAFEKSEKISFEIDYSRDIADGQEARLVWNHLKFGLAVDGDGLIVNVATASEGFKKIRVDNLGLNDTDDHTIRVIMDGVSNRLQVVVDNKVVLNTISTDLKFVGAGGYESGWMLGTPWNRYFDGDISDFRIEAKADFVGSTPASGMASTALAVTSPISTLIKNSSATLSDATSVTKVATTETPQKPVVDTGSQDATNTKLAGLLWGQVEKTFVVNDAGTLTQGPNAMAAPTLSSFAAMSQSTAAAMSAKVVIDTGVDRLNVFVKQPVVQDDEYLDAQLANSGGTPAQHTFAAVSEAHLAEVAPVVHEDAGSHVYDGHALFG